MTIEWEEAVVARGTFVKFGEHGDGITGWVEQYDPAAGATTFDGDVCGHIQVLDEDGASWVVSLDNSLKADRATGLSLGRGDYIDVRYRGDIEAKSGRTYKDIAFRKAKSAPPMPERKVEWAEAEEEPFVVDAGEWMPGMWGEYPRRMLP
jgi:hypothetical protein